MISLINIKEKGDSAKANLLCRIAFFNARAIAFQFRNNQKAIAHHLPFSKKCDRPNY
ncbi:MAG: hypothetical protein MUE44_17905 [Oscillatoriaceae cyanobacterium Prado104]|nr:hypothetical protein [Oscillatoriaceae cyanobacterium Prado104]